MSTLRVSSYQTKSTFESDFHKIEHVLFCESHFVKKIITTVFHGQRRKQVTVSGSSTKLE